MSSSSSDLEQMWQAFADRYQIKTHQVATLGNDDGIVVEISLSDVQAMFDYEGHFERKLAERDMKIKRQGNPTGLVVTLEIARLK